MIKITMLVMVMAIAMVLNGSANGAKTWMMVNAMVQYHNDKWYQFNNQ